jgi:hypothetical protein
VVIWPPHLIPLDFYFWGCLKENIYATKLKDHNNVINQTEEAAADIRNPLRQLFNITVRHVFGRSFQTSVVMYMYTSLPHKQIVHKNRWSKVMIENSTKAEFACFLPLFNCK